MTKIDAALNRARVKKSMENVDRLNIYLPKGTIERINKLGFKGSSFAKTLIMEELERLEKMQK
ncbi:MAG: hypothetical protein ACI4EU_02895 [Butyrivibrio sp.]